uniref:Peptidase A2 domain-containing protein n=1 Tax=Anopheles quadriannulatus TaxID=34691 RepID=A0A182XPM2_ANOQN
MIDSGADITLISKKHWLDMGKPAMTQPDIKAKTASGEPLHILGEFQCMMSIGQQCKPCMLYNTIASFIVVIVIIIIVVASFVVVIGNFIIVIASFLIVIAIIGIVTFVRLIVMHFSIVRDGYGNDCIPWF